MDPQPLVGRPVEGVWLRSMVVGTCPSPLAPPQQSLIDKTAQQQLAQVKLGFFYDLHADIPQVSSVFEMGI